MKGLLILTLLPAIALAKKWSIVYYSKPHCEGHVVAYDNVTSSSLDTCWQPSAHEGAHSAQISRFVKRDRYYWDDNPKVVRFYDNKDCTSHCTDRHVIAETDYHDCVSWESTVGEGRKMESYNIVETGMVGVDRHGVLSEGYCVLKHGDRLAFRGRQWRMQQVAAAFFNEIPAEEWDDTVHEANTTHRYAKHGDIDVFGHYKVWERDVHYLTEVRLEWWNETKHEKYEDRETWHRSSYDLESYYEEMKDDFCPDSDDDGTDKEEFISKHPELKALCGHEATDEDGKPSLRSMRMHKFASDVADTAQDVLDKWGL